MSYIFRNTILEYAAGGKANVLHYNIELMREAYPPQSFYAMMHLLSSHDQPRYIILVLIDEHVIVLARQLGKTWAITATNNDQLAHTVTIKIPESAAHANFFDALTGKAISTYSNTLTMEIPTLFGRALISR